MRCPQIGQSRRELLIESSQAGGKRILRSPAVTDKVEARRRVDRSSDDSVLPFYADS
jgi:hypothetical protein